MSNDGPMPAGFVKLPTIGPHGTLQTAGQLFGIVAIANDLELNGGNMRRRKSSLGDNGQTVTGDPTYDLLIAVVERAWDDVSGNPTPTCGVNRDAIIHDARVFLTILMTAYEPQFEPHGKLRARS